MMDANKYLNSLEIYRLDHPCEGIWFIHYNDGSVSVMDDHEKLIRTPLEQLDLVQSIKFLGTYQGYSHFAYKGCEYSTPHHPEYGIFDIRGHQKIFKDPRRMGWTPSRKYKRRSMKS